MSRHRRQRNRRERKSRGQWDLVLLEPLPSFEATLKRVIAEAERQFKAFVQGVTEGLNWWAEQERSAREQREDSRGVPRLEGVTR
jgi:hypothetical protein